MTIFGYARVSTTDQSLAAQKELLAKAGATAIFAEKVTGKEGVKRPELERLLKRLEAGDVVLVCKVDRLARSTRDLLNILHRVKEAGATFKALDDPWLDTTSAHGELLLTVLGGIATFERRLILNRTNEGRAKARAEGVVFGRKQIGRASCRERVLRLV